MKSTRVALVSSFLVFLGLLLGPGVAFYCQAATATNATAGDRLVADVFARETATLAKRCLAEIQTAEDWQRLKPDFRRQLFEMLSLEPLPPRGELKAKVTGVVEREDFLVEKLHFQSLPGLYVTANLYRPRSMSAPVPTILYLCGHGPVISNGVSYGNKVAYQHHGVWFARHGYICLVVDTLQLGEIQGIHHGTYREKMWWWNARGYTSAGVEAWNAIRALDYLQTRPDVDTNRFGVTGRSGGGAYSWWVGALDERVRVVAPVAGITDLHNHVVDGVVEGHCDCMYTVNTYRWDYAQVAALVAPRPLLIVNTDADNIFPLDGVVRLHRQVRRIYNLLQAPQQLGLVIGPGPHKDTQDLQVPVFRWFNRHLKGNEPLIESAAVKIFQPEELKVFTTLPADALNQRIQDTFVPTSAAQLAPVRRETWPTQRERWRDGLIKKVFAGWPQNGQPLDVKTRAAATRHNIRLEVIEFMTQEGLPLRLYLARPAELTKPDAVELSILGSPDQNEGSTRSLSMARWLAAWRVGFAEELAEELAAGPETPADQAAFAAVRQQLSQGRSALAWVAARGIGLTAWTADPKKQTHIRRRFMLLGETLDGMRVWDVRRAVQTLRKVYGLEEAPLTLAGSGEFAAVALHAALFEPSIQRLDLQKLPESYQAAPDYLNALRVLDLPQTLTLVLERCAVKLSETPADPWRYAVAAAAEMGWGTDRLSIEH